MTYEELVGSLDDMDMKAKELLKDGFPDPKTYYIIVDKQWQLVLVIFALTTVPNSANLTWSIQCGT
jgi:hypothetical protein